MQMQRKLRTNRTESKIMPKLNIQPLTPLELAKAAFPIFGGETEEENVTDEATSTESSDTVAVDTASDTSSTSDLSKNPEAIADLLKQLSDATRNMKNLEQKNQAYEREKAATTRAQQTREQQLEADLTDAQQTIAKMDAVIRHTAIINAIQGMKDYQFHSARHVLNELDSNSFDIDVDLENGTATISGIEAEIKRVAKEMPWLVAQEKTAGVPRSTAGRSSGAPPANPNGDAAKVARRAELMKKFPVIAQSVR